jgi:hypothetical protein
MNKTEIKKYFKKGLNDGLSVSFKLIKTIIPFYIAVDIINHTKIANTIGNILSPIMSIFGLTGKMSLALISGYTVNLYAAIAALLPLHPDWKEVTIVGLMSGISHNLIVEGAILHKAGSNAIFTVSLRIIVSFIAGISLNLIFKVFYG